MPALLLDRPALATDVLVRRTRSRRLWDAAADLVEEVSAHTGYPPRPSSGGAEVRTRTVQRQRAAESVWVATADAGRVVGHAIISWVTAADALYVQAAGVGDAVAAGRPVLLLGALAVHPRFQGHGIARQLRDARLAHIDRRRPDAVVVVAPWAGAVSEPWYRRHWIEAGEALDGEGHAHALFVRPRTAVEPAR